MNQGFNVLSVDCFFFLSLWQKTFSVSLTSETAGCVLQFQCFRGAFMPELRADGRTVWRLQGQVHLLWTVLLRFVRRSQRAELCLILLWRVFSAVTSLIAHRVQDALVWSWWPDRKRRLWGHQWPPEQVPQGDLPPAGGHRGPDRLWRTGLQHVRHLFKVSCCDELHSSSLHEDRVQHLWCWCCPSCLCYVQLWRHLWVRLCKCRSGEQELWRLQSQVHVSQGVLSRSGPVSFNSTHWWGINIHNNSHSYKAVAGYSLNNIWYLYWTEIMSVCFHTVCAFVLK